MAVFFNSLLAGKLVITYENANGNDNPLFYL